MSTHNICFCREIRIILCGYPLLSVAMLLSASGLDSLGVSLGISIGISVALSFLLNQRVDPLHAHRNHWEKHKN